MACARCETLPEPLPESGSLYIAPPESGVAHRLRSGMAAVGVTPREAVAGIMLVELGEGVLPRLCEEVFKTLNTLELRDTRCLLMPPGEEPGIAALLQMQPLEGLVARIEGHWLLSVLSEKRLTPVFQPIVPCDRPTEVFAYEALIRGRTHEGAQLSPGELFGRARSSDMLFQLDRGSRLAIIERAAAVGIQTKLFINFTPSAIYDPAFCLRTTVAAIEKTSLKPGDIVFEVVESEEIHDTKHLLRILDFYRENGYRVALDDLGAGFSSLNLLTELRPDFIKLDMHLIRDVDTNDYKGRILRSLIDLAHNLDIPVIAEGVETHAEWRWLRNAGADLIQGYLFAKPDATPPTPRIPPEN